MCGWLRVAAAFVKRRANAVTTGWDDETQDPMLRRMLDEIVMRSSQTDPARGDWCADGQRSHCVGGCQLPGHRGGY